jgi:hypothetical protein
MDGEELLIMIFIVRYLAIGNEIVRRSKFDLQERGIAIANS